MMVETSSFLAPFFMGLGGSLGAMARYYSDNLVANWSKVLRRENVHYAAWLQGFGIVLVNIVGSFFAGFVYQLVQNAWLLAFISTGFLGGYTTFSTAMTDVWRLIITRDEAGRRHKGIVFGVLSGLATLVLCIVSAYFGTVVGKLWT